MCFAGDNCAFLRADDLSSDLCIAGINSQALHGARSQMDRETVLKVMERVNPMVGTSCLQNFQQGRVRILIATDLASRGIDVPDVT